MLVFKPSLYLKNNAFKKCIYFINHKGCGAVSVLPEPFEFYIEQYDQFLFQLMHHNFNLLTKSLYMSFTNLPAIQSS
jgi:hypothetical protein